MVRLGYALVIAAVIGAAGSRPAGAVVLTVGSSVVVDGVTFQVGSCSYGGGACPTTDVMVADPSGAIGVTIENSAGALLTTTKGANSPDMSVSLDISSSVNPIVGIEGIITGSSSPGTDELRVGAGETLTFPGGANMTGPQETLAAATASVSFTGVTSLTASKDLHDLGALAQGTSPLVLDTISQVVTLGTPARVPEPQEMAIFATALSALMCAVRRRRR